ncbi:MAG: hypothetical protein KatS3mg111_3211 [Pirellulaceae bacterium]|nr:MAG: hypothetical protein KatS3mg111_3211 [Pirellulaceae bacterium]
MNAGTQQNNPSPARILPRGRQRPGASRRNGVTLLELVIAASMFAVVMTSLSLVLRTVRAAWETNDSDLAAIQHAHAVVRHFVRQAREAVDVPLLEPQTVQLVFRDASTQTWSYVDSGPSSDKVVLVLYSNTRQSVPMAYGIEDLSFRGFRADGTTPATALDEVQVIEITASVALPGKANQRESVSSKVWIRCW